MEAFFGEGKFRQFQDAICVEWDGMKFANAAKSHLVTLPNLE